jgi:hypothetical protein
MTLHELSAQLIEAQKLEAQAKQTIANLNKKIFDLAHAKQLINFQATYTFSADPLSLMKATIGWPAELQPAYLAPKIDHSILNRLLHQMPDMYLQIADLVDIECAPIGVSMVVETAA